MARKRAAGKKETPPDTPAAGAQAVAIVGVGASAGGLEAFSELLSHLPVKTGLAIVLIQHLPPSAASILPELLGRATSLPVAPVSDALIPSADHIYVLAPTDDVVMRDGRLHLVPRSSVKGVHLPIDYFFESLAADQGPKAIGVVLSGAASDGTRGLQQIKAAGGITFAQDPGTAHYDGMPRSAIAAGVVDMVLETSAIAAELARLGHHPYLRESLPTSVSRDEAALYADIFAALKRASGVDFSGYKMATVSRRVARRMAVNKLTELDQYVDFLSAHPVEIEGLYEDILIRVTEFFREPASFAALREQALPRLVNDSSEGAPLRIWVPGCASGEEAYSIAIELAAYLRAEGLPRSFKLFATDINDADIAQARRALYSSDRVASVPGDYLQRYFVASQDGYEVSEAIREACVFARHDVTSDAPFSRIDLISCRNLLIYLGAALQERVLPMFHYALRPNGLLMLGGSESIGAAKDLFSALDAKRKLYQRRQTKARLPVEFAKSPATSALPAAPPARHGARSAVEASGDPLRVADSLVMSKHAPPGVVIGSDFRIVQFRGDTEAYLVQRPGEPTLDLLSMARDGLETALRGAVAEVGASGTPVQRKDVALMSPRGAARVDVVVEPLGERAGERYFLVLFSQARAVIAPGVASDEADHERLVLRSELEASRQHLEQLLAEKDVAVEELRAANEEIQSSNEELQSINEELETAKEELQSTNEELRTVNEELESRNAQLSRANDDLTNLLSGIHLPIIMVDRELRLRRVTAQAERLIAMTPADVGRPIADFRLRFAMPDLAEALTEVIKTMVFVERDVLAEDSRWYSLRIRPYLTHDNHVEGAIMTLVDIDELHRSLDRLTDAARFNEGLERIGAALRDSAAQRRSLTQVLSLAAAAQGAHSASLMVRREEHWVTAAGYGLEDQAIGLKFSDAEFPHAALAAAARAPVAINHVAADRRLTLEVMHRFALQSVLVAPLFVDDEVAATLVFNWHTEEVALSQGQIDFAGKVGVLLGLVLETGKAAELS